jgi:ApbE superfamily uncharacterized protein (UPF0280 family)
MRRYRDYRWRGARYRICSTRVDPITVEIRRQRRMVEMYIARHPAFGSSLAPLAADADAPPIVRWMAEKAELAGVGPMAAVAGAIAELAARAALGQGAEEAIVENGGDIFLSSARPVTVGLFAGANALSGKLAFLVEPSLMPLSVCSSSSLMGHSLSLGRCDLATVAAKDAALADAAATRACNLVRTEGDVAEALERVVSIPGVSGVLIVKADKIGMAGDLPELIRRSGRNDEVFYGSG